MYEQGRNISSFLREEARSETNTREIIEIAYDLQAGSYIDNYENKGGAEHKDLYARKIAAKISDLCDKPASILEAGVGEATTLLGVLRNLPDGVNVYGFDLSWSRIAVGKAWLGNKGFASDINLCVGDLFHIPFVDSSIDVVYTSHSIEPNGRNEKPILRELYRVTRKYLVLLEPAYELVDEKTKQRMDSHGYCKGLPSISKSLGYDVIDHKLFLERGEISASTGINPTAITIIKKEDDSPLPFDIFACPKYKTPLREIKGALFSPEALCIYPVINGIPCLRVEHAILASKYEEIINASA